MDVPTLRVISLISLIHRVNEVVVEFIEFVIQLFDALFFLWWECLFEYFDSLKEILEYLSVDIGDLVVAQRLRCFVGTAYDTCGDTYSGGAWRYILDHDGVGTDFGVFSYDDIAQYFGTCTDYYATLYGRVTFAGAGADPSEGDLLIDKDIILDDGSLTDDHTHSMIDKYAPTNCCTRMDIDHRQEHPQCGDEPWDKTQSTLIEPVCDTVEKERPETWIVKKEFKCRMKCRVILFDRSKIFFDQFK